MRFELIDNKIVDMDTQKQYNLQTEVCELLNQQEMEKMKYKMKLKTLMYRIEKVLENV